MATLVIKSAETGDRVIELNLGVNRLGRSPKNDIPIEHPTVSARHCARLPSTEGVTACDCTAANGRFQQRARKLVLQVAAQYAVLDQDVAPGRLPFVVHVERSAPAADRAIVHHGAQ